MIRLAGPILRVAALWMAFAAPLIVAAPLLGLTAPQPAPVRGLTAGQAFLVVNTIYALMLAWLAARSRFSRAGRFAAFFTIVFGVQTVMAHSETLFFGEAFDFSTLNLPALVALNAIVALTAAATAAAIYPVSASRDALSATGAPASAMAWASRLAAAAALYVVAYLAAGTFIAWTSPAVRAFYGQDIGFDQLALVDQLVLVAFQGVRGFAWAGLFVLVLASHNGGRTARALAATTALTAFLAPGLLFPNPAMPEPVRYRHFIELVVSMTAWGVVASLILAPLAQRVWPTHCDTSTGACENTV